MLQLAPLSPTFHFDLMYGGLEEPYRLYTKKKTWYVVAIEWPNDLKFTI